MTRAGNGTASSVPRVKLNLVNNVPDGLTRRARTFVGVHGVRADVRPVAEHRQWWLDRGVPSAAIDRMTAFEERWGGLLLPPAPPLLPSNAPSAAE